MIFDIDHTGFVYGKPPRFRQARYLPVVMTTRIEVQEVNDGAAPLACVLTEKLASGLLRTEFRFFDGSFYREAPRSLQLAINIESADTTPRRTINSFSSHDQGFMIKPYSDRFPFTEYSLRAARPPVPRTVADWNAVDLDLSDQNVFETAVREYMENFIIVDGKLFVKSFEPSYAVQLKRFQDRTVVALVSAGTANFYPFVDVRDRLDGLDVMRSQQISDRSIRYFSISEYDRACEFIRENCDNDTLVSFNLDTVGLTDFNRSFFSESFDEQELGRSARAWMSVPQKIFSEAKWIAGKGDSWVDFDALEQAVAKLKDSLTKYEGGSGDSDTLVADLEDLQDRCGDAITRYRSLTSKEMHDVLPLRYFGDAPEKTVSLSISLPSAIS